MWERFGGRGVLAVVMALVIGCGGGDTLEGPPVGEPMLPDLVSAPPSDLAVSPPGEEGEPLRFTSTIRNVGLGDFVLRGTRDGERWTVEQAVPYSESGSEAVAVDAPMVWGGDGHEHWHVERVAVHWLVPLDEGGEPVEDFDERFDAKVGFCFYDAAHSVGFGAERANYSEDECGDESSETFSMGLSVGWSDVYDFVLPGQSIDISGLPDGRYRLYAEADQNHAFQESDSTNNVTWIDIEVIPVTDTQRAAQVIGEGPDVVDQSG